MSESDEYAPVIPLRKGADAQDDARPLARRERPPWCQHRRQELDEEARRCYCRDCGREVPPFDVLLDLTRDWEWYIHGREEAHRRIKVAQENLADLLREEKNAKARQRTRRRKEPDALRHLRAVMGVLRRVPEGGVLRAAYDYLSDLDGR